MEEKENPIVLLATSMGDIKIELWEDRAPVSVDNFLQYVKEKFYDGTIFHRVIENFMIQGGGLSPDMREKTAGMHPAIKNEASSELKNENGTIAMARTMIVDSATSQFFINVNDNEFLDHKDDTAQNFGYAVFGRVIEGMDVVETISKTKTSTIGPYNDVPAKPILIKGASLLPPQSTKNDENLDKKED